jgi:hypothetical protein
LRYAVPAITAKPEPTWTLTVAETLCKSGLAVLHLNAPAFGAPGSGKNQVYNRPGVFLGLLASRKT